MKGSTLRTIDLLKKIFAYQSVPLFDLSVNFLPLPFFALFLKYTAYSQTSWRPDTNYSKLEAICNFSPFYLKLGQFKVSLFFSRDLLLLFCGPFDILLRPFIGRENAKRDYPSEDDVNVDLHRCFLYQ